MKAVASTRQVSKPSILSWSNRAHLELSTFRPTQFSTKGSSPSYPARESAPCYAYNFLRCPRQKHLLGDLRAEQLDAEQRRHLSTRSLKTAANFATLISMAVGGGDHHLAAFAGAAFAFALLSLASC